ncbi:hypothetical protein JM658_08620 [Joostella atrarenae]|uniref:Uncharacterized protein n=1 Tax=Joostella atrarenae TaxID=679257 RepID=A0ABS9J379_9FLAO|nr:hypothetical protein [Joostella atrarenae]MCF8714891.1 hypothetical protein [Joostella atrarenae]
MKSDLPIRDFELVNDTLYYTHKDFVKVSVEGRNIRNIYLGGYILHFSISDHILSGLANNYKIDLGAIRRYDFLKSKYTHIYHITKRSPIISYDYYSIEKDPLSIIVSYKDGSLISYDSKGNKVDMFREGGSIIRQVTNINGVLYYCNDGGELYKIINGESEKLFASANKILGFISKGNYIYMYNDNGQIININMEDLSHNTIQLEDNIIMDICFINNAKMIVADWDGYIFVLDISKNKIENKVKAHKDIIYKIQRINDSLFATSSRDKKIKKWNINKL